MEEETGVAPLGLMTTKEAAAYLGVKPELLTNWRWMKKGPVFLRVGGKSKYRKSDLDAFVKIVPATNSFVKGV